ncbi:hypothetical protein [Cohnella silvisoli]|uniref:YqzN/YkzM domain-containing protein n=1 Tax=Cohnella silvisoli TaxID=2873699 RepID=A0ABV1L217_9BACL|nr:hypothetical protein [Cohnella silvisoli]
MAIKDTVLDDSPRLQRDELMAHAQVLFGIQPEVVAGALHESDQGEWTVDQARSLVDKFLKRKVN